MLRSCLRWLLLTLQVQSWIICLHISSFTIKCTIKKSDYWETPFSQEMATLLHSIRFLKVCIYFELHWKKLWWRQFSLHRVSLIHNLESSVSSYFIHHNQMHHQEMLLLGDSTQPRDGKTIAQCKISLNMLLVCFCLFWGSGSFTILRTYILNQNTFHSLQCRYDYTLFSMKTLREDCLHLQTHL